MAKEDNKAKRVTIERKTGFDWAALKTKVEQEHWRKFRVEIKLRDKLHAGKPAQLDAAKAMLAARGLEEVVEAREIERPVEERVEEAVDEGLCEFHRREGKPGIWWPANNFKACLKENWSVLGYRMDATPRSERGEESPVEEVPNVETTTEEGTKKKVKKVSKRKTIQGSRAMMAEGVFVRSDNPDDLDWIYLGESPAGIDTSVSHIKGPTGPIAAIKRNEYVIGRTLVFEIWIARAGEHKIPDESFADTLLHAQEHGIGANRSQGYGTFNVVSCTEL